MGLLESAQQTQQQPEQNTPQAQPAQQSKPEQGQQEMYERLASMALQYVYSEKGAAMVQEGLHLEHADIVQNAANIVSKILMRLIISVRTQGGAIPAKMMIQIGMETSVAVLEIAEADQSLPNAGPGQLDAVFMKAIDITGKELPKGMLGEQERQEVRATLEQVVQMQQPTQPNQQGMPQ